MDFRIASDFDIATFVEDHCEDFGEEPKQQAQAIMRRTDRRVFRRRDGFLITLPYTGNQIVIFYIFSSAHGTGPALLADARAAYPASEFVLACHGPERRDWFIRRGFKQILDKGDDWYAMSQSG